VEHEGQAKAEITTYSHLLEEGKDVNHHDILMTALHTNYPKDHNQQNHKWQNGV
jgi:hypothetical protein